MSRFIKDHKNPTGAWVVPEDQVKEFTKSGGPDYDQLIIDCLNEYRKTRKLAVLVENPKPKKKSYFKY